MRACDDGRMTGNRRQVGRVGESGRERERAGEWRVCDAAIQFFFLSLIRSSSAHWRMRTDGGCDSRMQNAE